MRLDRIERDEEVLVDVIDCVSEPDLNDTALACRTVDVSEKGMQITTQLLIPVHTILGLTLDMAGNLYRLQGEVRWARKDESAIGLLLDDDESPDIGAWNKMFQLDF